MRLERMGKFKKKSNDFIGIRARNLLACSTAPEPTTLPRALFMKSVKNERQKH
jgi:hypothetical protein